MRNRFGARPPGEQQNQLLRPPRPARGLTRVILSVLFVLSVFVSPWWMSPVAAASFEYDVLPALTKAGCNQGACHGNAEGRGGLRLSLRGEDPAYDYEVLARHGGGRRVNAQDPGSSLLLLKATALMAHGGGRRIHPESPEFDVTARWIAGGAPYGGEDSRLERLEVAPRETILFAPKLSQQLRVTGHFSDGTRRDLTDRALYIPADPRVEVSDGGEVTADPGIDTTVLVRFAEQLGSARVTFVRAAGDFRWPNPTPLNWVDEIQFPRLKQVRLAPSRLTNDTEFLRRAYLDTLGVLPEPGEVRTFLADRRPDRRARLIDALLDRPEFDDYWAMKWSDILRIEDRSLDRRGASAYRDWIRRSLAERKPLDRFAREILTATGSTYANPPANYYRRTRSPVDLAETTAQVFLGVRMGCAKCHNHPTERWTQDDYYGLAASFARVHRKLDDLGRRDRFDLHELNGEEIISLGERRTVEHPRTKRAAPAAMPTVGFTGEGETDAREALADWIVRRENPYFAKAMVNRVWYHLFGKGQVDPVDDLRDSNPAANPVLFEALSRDFVAHEYDLRHLVRTIMNSRTYQAAAEPNATNAEDERFFSRALPQRLPAEVLLDAVSQVTGVSEQFPGYPRGTRAALLLASKRQHPFLKLFGQPARESVCECERTGDATLGQSFALISGEMINRKVADRENWLTELLASGRGDAEILEDLYLASVTREPTTEELQAALAHLAKGGDRRAAYEDLLWALLNSREFLLRG
jgi:hypothetical protein